MGTTLHSATEVSKQMTYVAIMSTFARRGDYATVRGLFEEMTSSGIPADHTHFNCLLTSCVQPRYADIAEGIITLMPQWGLQPRVEDYTALIQVCRADLPRCQTAFAKIAEAGLSPSYYTYKHYILAHLEAGDSEATKKLLDVAEKTPYCDQRFID